mmetsp:Transcript_9634/g.35728  ORF Transcript_9634/g.35728 Transcript_9634/m.35728 type:complete len:101 (-) Transcript_9634:518-820(-)
MYEQEGSSENWSFESVTFHKGCTVSHKFSLSNNSQPLEESFVPESLTHYPNHAWDIVLREAEVSATLFSNSVNWSVFCVRSEAESCVCEERHHFSCRITK